MSDEREALAEQIVEQIRDALDMDPGEKLVIQTPQFDRIDNIDPDSDESPLTHASMDRLKQADEDTLRDLGLQPFGEYGLWLLPHEWHPHIPADYPLLDILGETVTRAEYPSNPDKRFGALSFGIVPEFEDADPPNTSLTRVEDA